MPELVTPVSVFAVTVHQDAIPATKQASPERLDEFLEEAG
jgi:hypothetical protein